MECTFGQGRKHQTRRKYIIDQIGDTLHVQSAVFHGIDISQKGDSKGG
jgi:hypothetical protein